MIMTIAQFDGKTRAEIVRSRPSTNAVRDHRKADPESANRQRRLAQMRAALARAEKAVKNFPSDPGYQATVLHLRREMAEAKIAAFIWDVLDAFPEGLPDGAGERLASLLTG